MVVMVQEVSDSLHYPLVVDGPPKPKDTPWFDAGEDFFNDGCIDIVERNW